MKQISIALAKWHGVIASVERDEESGSDTDDTLSTASRDIHSCSTVAGAGSSGGTGGGGVSRDESRGKEGPFADGMEERVGEVGGEGRGGQERERERRRGREALLDRLVGQLEVMRECCALALMLGRQVVHVCVRAYVRTCGFCVCVCVRVYCHTLPSLVARRLRRYADIIFLLLVLHLPFPSVLTFSSGSST